ncbi:hypothetical protein G3545_28140 [Starkeya sp. ORNL1]|uniref:hypothetical protein n=1 Tax=Starkeya sp. ORNL1 TaxID=2709380 RepID=UPI0014634332|nr:hypothetical protein [Starkeya sp. ORNL1]QJP17173.1 hypothetical protein G3545_28140 [Starkeya sp. ORNL1]
MKRAFFAAALLPLLAAPCLAQEATSEDVNGTSNASGAPAEPAPVVTGTIPGRGGADPWSGIVIVVTPPPAEDAAPDESGQALGLADQLNATPPTDADGPQSIALLPGDETTDEATDEMPSLWTSLDLGIGDGVEMPPPRKVATVPTQPVKAAPAQPLPTSFDLRQGPAQVAIITSVSTTPPISDPMDGNAGGGSGEVKGRLGYVLDNWSVYGVGGFGAAESTGTLSVYDSLMLGGTYTIPLAPYGLGANDSIGAKLEVGDTQATTTSVEMRSGQGNYQRFISVERSTAPTAAPSDTVRAGVVGKF